MAKKVTAAEGFLRAINEEPDEDAHRLVYADWLDDNGQPERAEFIRVQCALPRMAPDDPRRPGLAAREQALYDAHHRAWRDELADWARPRAYGLHTFRRGFVAHVLCTARQWLKGAGTLLRRVPPPDRLILYNCRDALADLARSPHLACVAALSLREVNGVADLAGLAAATNLKRLTDFELHRTWLGDSSVPVLLSLPLLPRLTRLGLEGNNLGDAAVAELAASPAVAGLTDLDLVFNPRLGAGAAAAVAASPHLAGLRRLNLSQCPVGDDGLRRLSTSTTLTRLARLDLRDAGVGSAGLAALAASPLIERLTDLGLYKGRVGPEGLEALAATPRPTRLETLELSECPVGDCGVAALAASPVASTLRCLRLNLTDVGPVGTAALASSPRLAGLEELALTAGPLGDEAAAALLRSPHLARLRVLWIRKNGLSEATLRELHDRFGY
jgi:uncharacterized protein (TIGR02996 family)